MNDNPAIAAHQCYAITVRPYPKRYTTQNFMPKLIALLSPYQSEAAIDFVKKQSDFVKKLCRITKYWQQSVPYFEFIAGRSFIFECLAIK